MVALGDFKSAPALVVTFICNHCPYVKHIQAAWRNLRATTKRAAWPSWRSVPTMFKRIQRTARPKWRRRPSQPVTLSPIFTMTASHGQGLPRGLHAGHFSFDANRKLAYRGQFDDSRPGNGVPVTGRDLRASMDAVTCRQTGVAAAKFRV